MTPNELSKLPAVRVDSDLFYVSQHMKHEVDQYELPDADPAGRITTKYFANCSIDSSRCWTLAAAYLDDVQFIIMQNAGRGGLNHSEYCQRFVTNMDVYCRAIAYLRSLYQPNVHEDFRDPDADIEDLTSFFGDNLASITKFEQDRPKSHWHDQPEDAT